MKWQSVAIDDVLLAHDSGVWGAEDVENGVSVLRSTNMQNDGTIDFSKLALRAIPDDKRATKLLQPGDILLENSGGGPKQPVGRVCYFHGDAQDHVAGNFCRRLRVNRDVALPRFLFWNLFYLHATGETERFQTQTTGIRNLQFRLYAQHELSLPPPSEQRRIVEILDQADALRKLCRDADAKAARVLPALFLKMFGAPSTWKRTRPLGELVTMQSGGTPSKAVPEFWDGTIPWVSPKDMKRDEIADAEDHVSDAALRQSAIHMISSNSILIVVRGMILAHDVPIAITRAPVTINQDMKALTLTDDQMAPLFLFAAMRAQAPRLHAEVSTAAHGTKRIETSRLASLPILIAAPAAVTRFTSEYESVLTLDKVRATIAPKVETLFSILLQRAFSGQLTAKWRQAHMRELLVEMQEQARLLNLPAPN